MDASKEPVTTHVEGDVEGATMTVEADAETHARGSAEVEAEITRRGEQVREQPPPSPRPAAPWN